MVRFAQNAFKNGRTATQGAWMAGWALFLLQASGFAQAQTAAPAKTDGDIKTPYLDNYTPSEEVKRRALGPLRIIKQTVDQKKPATPTAAPNPAPTSPAPTVAAKPKLEEAAAKADKTIPVAETPAAPTPVEVAAPAPVAAPIAPPPEPPKVAKHVNTELIPLVQDPPVLSRNLLREIPKGVVKVAFDVNPDGTTSGIQAVSSTNRRLNPSAIDAVSKWKFKPIDESIRVDIELLYTSE